MQCIGGRFGGVYGDRNEASLSVRIWSHVCWRPHTKSVILTICWTSCSRRYEGKDRGAAAVQDQQPCM